MKMFNCVREAVSSLSGENGQLISFKYTWSTVVFLHNIDTRMDFFHCHTLTVYL